MIKRTQRRGRKKHEEESEAMVTQLERSMEMKTKAKLKK